MGRLGRFDPDSFAITVSSVERCQFRFDLDVLSQGPAECPPSDRALEAREPPARVGAATGLLRARDEPAVLGDEAQELALRSPAAAADTAPDRHRHAFGVPSAGEPASGGGSTAACCT